MSPLSLAALAVSMSIDGFAASVGRGAALGPPRAGEALRTGLVFGAVEAVTPLIGWAAGTAASGLVQAVDHWIAFLLLAAIGGRMIRAALWGGEHRQPAGRSPGALAATAIGTSLDAMAVGVSLAFLNANILVFAGAVGFATFALAAMGTLIGRSVGERLGRYAEVAAGITLFLIGLRILLQHLAA